MKSHHLLLLALALSICDAYPEGAPPMACQSMVPLHGAPPSPGIGFYTIMTEKTADGVMGLITTSGPDHFEGFLIQAREVATDRIVGSFWPEATPGGMAQGLTCLQTGNDSLTQNLPGGCTGGGSSEEGGSMSAGGGEGESTMSAEEGEESMSAEEGDSMSGETPSMSAENSAMSKEESMEGGGSAGGGGGGSLEVRELEFLWVPPEGYSGDVRFVATVVEDLTVFYVGIESEVFSV